MIKLNQGQKKIIEANAMALATVDKTGKPHCIAVGDVKVVGFNQLLIGVIYLRQTIKNIEHNDNISMVVWSRNWEEECVGFEFIGRAKYFSSGKWREMANKIHEGFPVKGAILVTINKVKRLA